MSAAGEQQRGQEEGTTTSFVGLLDQWTNKEKENDSDPFLPKATSELQQLTSRESYSNRLQTFHPMTYFCKPASLSPLVCARFGWINTSADMIKCACCKAALVVTIHPKITKPLTITKLVKAYQSKLATAHKENCPFRVEAELHLLTNDNEQHGIDEINHVPNNIVPSYFASILPQDIWAMIEQPSPLVALQKRFDALVSLLANDYKSPEDGAPPEWKFPALQLSNELLNFSCNQADGNVNKCDGNVDSSDEASQDDHRKSPPRRRRMLAKLAFDPKNPFTTTLGLEHETLLTKLDHFLRVHDPEDDIRAQTRSQGAWEEFYEGIAALALLGWIPTTTSITTEARMMATNASGLVSLHCQLCLSHFQFNLQKYDHHHHHRRLQIHRQSDAIGTQNEDNDDKTSPPRKRLRRHNRCDGSIDPLAAHRHHCPFVCGFPRDGQRKTTPIWQLVASKVVTRKHERKSEVGSKPEDEEGTDGSSVAESDAKMDRILNLLNASISTRSKQKHGIDDATNPTM